MTDLHCEAVVFLSSTQGFIYGMAGGFCAELIGWYKIRTTLYNSYPDFAKSWVYWSLTLMMILVGGGLVSVYIESGFQFKALLAINIGATAPLILEALTRHTPQLAPGKVD